MRFASNRQVRRWVIPALSALCLAVRSAPAQQTGFLKVFGQQDTIVAIVDGQAHTFAVTSVYPCPVGKHRLIVQNPNIQDYAQLDFDTSFEIRMYDTTHVYVGFQKLIRVQSIPSGAWLSRDDHSLGTTPAYLKSSELRVSNHIQVSKPGYHPKVWVVTAGVLDSSNVTIELTADESAGATQLQVNDYWKQQGYKRHSRPLMVAAGLAVVSGAVTAYFKNRADDYFERAKLERQAGNVALQKRLEKKTRRYDRYAAVGFVGMEVNVTIVLGLLLLGK